MKTKSVILGALLLVATVSYFFSNSAKTELSDLLLMNVEALADDESNQNIICYQCGSVDCPVNKVKAKYVAAEYSLEVLH